MLLVCPYSKLDYVRERERERVEANKEMKKWKSILHIYRRAFGGRRGGLDFDGDSGGSIDVDHLVVQLLQLELLILCKRNRTCD